MVYQSIAQEQPVAWRGGVPFCDGTWANTIEVHTQDIISEEANRI